MAVQQPHIAIGGFGGSIKGSVLGQTMVSSSQHLGHPIPVAGKFKNWRLMASSGLTEDVTSTIRKNGSATALTQTILTGNTTDASGTDIDEVSFSALDIFTFTRTGNPNIGCWSRIVWVPDDGVSQIYVSHRPAFPSGEYFGLLNTHNGFLGSGGGTTEALMSSLCGLDGTITTFAVVTGAVSTGSRVYTIYKNGVAQDGSGGTPDTRVTITSASAGGGTKGSSTFSLSVVAGDRLSVRCDVTGGAGNGDYGGAIAFEADTEAYMYGGMSANSNTSGTNYYAPYPPNVNTVAQGSESGALYLGAEDLVIGGLRVFRTSAVPGGHNHVFTGRVDGADTALVVTLPEGEQAAGITGESIAIPFASSWALRDVQTGGVPASYQLKYVWTTGVPILTSECNIIGGEEHEIHPGSDVNGLFGRVRRCR